MFLPPNKRSYVFGSLASQAARLAMWLLPELKVKVNITPESPLPPFPPRQDIGMRPLPSALPWMPSGGHQCMWRRHRHSLHTCPKSHVSKTAGSSMCCSVRCVCKSDLDRDSCLSPAV